MSINENSYRNWVTLQQVSRTLTKHTEEHIRNVTSGKVPYYQWLTLKSPMGTGKSFNLTASRAEQGFSGLVEIASNFSPLVLVLTPYTDNQTDVSNDIDINLTGSGIRAITTVTEKNWRDRLQNIRANTKTVITMCINTFYRNIDLFVGICNEKQIKPVLFYDEFHYMTAPQSDDPDKNKELYRKATGHPGGKGYVGIVYNGLIDFNKKTQGTVIGMTATPHVFIGCVEHDPNREEDAYKLVDVVGEVARTAKNPNFTYKVPNGILDDTRITNASMTYDDTEEGKIECLEDSIFHLLVSNAEIKQVRNSAKELWGEESEEYKNIAEVFQPKCMIVYNPNAAKGVVKADENRELGLEVKQKLHGKEVEVFDWIKGEYVTVTLDGSKPVINNHNNSTVKSDWFGNTTNCNDWSNQKFIEEMEYGESDIAFMVMKGRMGISIRNADSVVILRPNKGKEGVVLMIVQQLGRLNRSMLPKACKRMWDDVASFANSMYGTFAETYVQNLIRYNSKGVYAIDSDRTRKALSEVSGTHMFSDGLMMLQSEMYEAMSLIDIEEFYPMSERLEFFAVGGKRDRLIYTTSYLNGDELSETSFYYVNLDSIRINDESKKDFVYSSTTLSELKRVFGAENVIKDDDADEYKGKFDVLEGDKLTETFKMSDWTPEYIAPEDVDV